MEEQSAVVVQGGALAGPVAQGERISAVDTLRGFALLGILVMNIGDYALHEGFDFHPTSLGNIGKFNLILWAVRFVLFEGKMRGIFSMLFGAGVILLTSRLEKRGERTGAADIFLRRNMWLVAIGVIHGYFLWWGDILYGYAITATFVSLSLPQAKSQDANRGGDGDLRDFQYFSRSAV